MIPIFVPPFFCVLVLFNQGSEQGSSGFANFSSSPKSPLSPEKSWRVKDDNCSVKHDDKDEMCSVGQCLRIRVGPLKGIYLSCISHLTF